MANWTKPLPNIDEDIAPFWEGLRRREFLLFLCKSCGAYYWPAAYCVKCPAEPYFGNMVWSPSSGRGTVFSFNVQHRSSHPGFNDMLPYVFALIELDEGPMFGTNVVGCPAQKVTIGMKVKVKYEDAAPSGADPFTLALFEPA